MRTPIVAGNWKMNNTISEATLLVMRMREKLNTIEGLEKVLCPPFVSLSTIRQIIRGLSIKLGAQNMHFEESGAYTGEVSPLMVAELCEYVILGHSERRQYFGETDEVVNRKVKAALKVGLKPILCVGETLEENEAGRTVEVVTRQVGAALDGVESPKGLVIAYEPLWAIGTGRASSGEQANATIGVIRRTLAEIYGDEYAQATRIQYGGSVSSSNITEFMQQEEIDGALVGGASLRADDFISIVEQAAASKRRK